MGNKRRCADEASQVQASSRFQIEKEASSSPSRCLCASLFEDAGEGYQERQEEKRKRTSSMRTNKQAPLAPDGPRISAMAVKVTESGHVDVTCHVLCTYFFGHCD